jgi:hypothetical protein
VCENNDHFQSNPPPTSAQNTESSPQNTTKSPSFLSDRAKNLSELFATILIYDWKSPNNRATMQNKFSINYSLLNIFSFANNAMLYAAQTVVMGWLKQMQMVE